MKFFIFFISFINIASAQNECDSLLYSKHNVILFFNTSCPICQFEIDEVKRINNFCKEKNIPFWIVFQMYEPETSAEIEGFLRSHSLNTSNWKINTNSRYSKCLNAVVTPQIFIVNNERSILYSGKLDDRLQNIGRKKQTISHHYVLDNLKAYMLNQPLPYHNTEPIGCFIE